MWTDEKIYRRINSVGRALTDLLLLARATDAVVGTFGSTFSTLAADLSGGAPLVNVKAWNIAAYCLPAAEDDVVPGVPDSFRTADCTSVDDADGAPPTTAAPRLQGARLEAACRDRARNASACGAARPRSRLGDAPFGVACWD